MRAGWHCKGAALPVRLTLFTSRHLPPVRALPPAQGGNIPNNDKKTFAGTENFPIQHPPLHAQKSLVGKTGEAAGIHERGWQEGTGSIPRTTGTGLGLDLPSSCRAPMGECQAVPPPQPAPASTCRQTAHLVLSSLYLAKPAPLAVIFRLPFFPGFNNCCLFYLIV